MKDDNGRVLIKGYYDGVRSPSAERASPGGRRRRRSGAAQAHRHRARRDASATNYQEALQYPSLNVRGMASAGVGAKAANIVPSEAVAELDMRTTPATRRTAAVRARCSAHIEQQGYHLVDGAPTDDERARYDKLASFTLGSAQAAARTPMDSAVGRWAYAALRARDRAEARRRSRCASA